MLGDEAHRFAHQLYTGRHSMPRRRSGGMGQGNQVERALVSLQSKRTTYHCVQLLKGKELSDREFADRNNKLWLKKGDLVIHPARAVLDFISRRNSIAPCGSFAGKTAADCSKVDSRTHLRFAELAEFVKPCKERSTGGPGERFRHDWFSHTGSLPDEHYLANHGSTGNRLGIHHWAASALEQADNMLIQ